MGLTGPGIEQDQWPRSTFTGCRAAYFTVRLPGSTPAGCAKASGRCSVLFSSPVDGQFAEDEAAEGVANATSDDPFEVQYAQAPGASVPVVARYFGCRLRCCT